jgi:4-phosphopantoate--beta-alanine ligase
MNENNHNNAIPKSHPRYLSLKYRHKIIEGLKNLIVAEAGLIAHGRGECFDYILGEKTLSPAKEAMKAAIAALLLAKRPIISVNGNVAALVSNEVVEFSKRVNAAIEINLFYRKEGRIEAISNVLKKAGATNILGTEDDKMIELDGLESNRRRVDQRGIFSSDLVMVPLEDGDRTEALKKLGKKVIAIDLNPISRTSLWADITIVDNIIRVLPQMIEMTKKLKKYHQNDLNKIIMNFNNKKNIQDVLDLIKNYIEAQKNELFKK